ncbi:D-2-hydroxyacid dehydrogenase [Lentilactobacillus laojiaonis]|uniref:D-2-hydroxyacid dehydrogenase n=1 Tax=Lentilactobacillus laojiaonis TaxID=2883998 RepID=UPI001D0B24D1|nr:D-2-hydroxyacid dehydrogenase [Lentilactobacillus laojiaonis]UDM31666.1 D-2-hydroxyacid dehydrogenase [Lentilactobacillus laojiaonis]
MKIMAYGIRDDEKPFLDQWISENTNVTVESTAELLDENTAKQAAGADGVVAYQQMPYTAKVLDTLGELGVKNLSLRNVGVDNIDVAAAKRNDIKVTNVPAYSPEAIAEFTVTQLLRLLRNTNTFDRKQAQGDLRWAPDIADELNQKTVGVYATGRIGRAAIKIYQGFGAKVIAYDIYRNPELDKQGIYVDTPQELFNQSDVISLHAPATKENFHMINENSINQMKDDVIILNPARGDLIDTDALIKALDNGKVRGAALDVYENEVGVFNNEFDNFEAIPDERLKNLMRRDNVLVSPHIAFYTKKAVRNMVYFAMNANKDLIESGTSDKLVEL